MLRLAANELRAAWGVGVGLVPTLRVGIADTGRAQDPPLRPAGGAYIAFYVCVPRTRATTLSPRPIRILF
jgi:hypothetical protein